MADGVNSKGFFGRLVSGLSKTREQIMGGVSNVLKHFRAVDEELFEELEEALILADVGVPTAAFFTERLRARAKEKKAQSAEDVRAILAEIIAETLDFGAHELKTPAVVLVVGVNGVGKTTTCGKLASYYREQGKSVILAAADTFRAAAIDQLKVWGERSGASVIAGQENGDPGAVVFDAARAAKARGTDVLLIDTAGRLHNKKNLMEELGKISRIIEREYGEATRETWLVLDAATGQNAISQAAVFQEITNVNGIVITKLDGTAKGGVILALINERKLPPRFIGVGEGAGDLQPFDADEFASALLGIQENSKPFEKHFTK